MGIINLPNMKFKQILQTKNISPGVNKKMFIVLHHTGTSQGTLKGNLNILLGLTDRKVSAHYLIDGNGDVYKLANDEQITWHAGESEWKGLKDLNKYSIGIEIIGPGFTNEQRLACKELVKYLLKKNNITYENLIRHKDVAPGRKSDISDSFWNNEFNTFEDYKLQFKNNTMTSKYEEIMNTVLKEKGFSPVFNEHEGDGPLSEKDVKCLIEIALANLVARLSK